MHLIRMIIIIAILVVLLQLISLATSSSLAGLIRSGRGQQLEKIAPFECGLEPFGNSRVKFEVLFYLVGLLYLIFDLEIVLLLPLVMTCSSLWIILNPLAFGFVLFFIALLTLAFLYEWFTGALNFQVKPLDSQPANQSAYALANTAPYGFKEG